MISLSAEIMVVQRSVIVLESDGEAQLTVAISMPPGRVPIETSFSLIVNTLDGTATGLSLKIDFMNYIRPVARMFRRGIKWMSNLHK